MINLIDETDSLVHNCDKYDNKLAVVHVNYLRRVLTELRDAKFEQETRRCEGNDCVSIIEIVEANEEIERLKSQLNKLSDPHSVHISMLRGTIAKPTWDQMKHVYGVA